MKTRALFLLLVCGSMLSGRAQERATFDQAVEKAALEYAGRLQKASAELTAARERIAREKAPLLQVQRQAEDRLLAAESNLLRYQTTEFHAAEQRGRLAKAAASLQRNHSYVTTVAQDALRGFGAALAPGEDRLLGDKVRLLQQALDRPGGDSGAAVDAAEFLLARVQLSLGGYTTRGGSMIGDGNEVKNGTFAFVGPQTFFRADTGEVGVAVRLREAATFPTTFVVKSWPADSARALFQGQPGVLPADASGNKALRLQQTTGTLWQHIEKGGYVAYAILGVGLLALGLIVSKLVDASRLAVDEPAAVHTFLARLSDAPASASVALGSLQASTRELFATGLRHLDESKVALEERLQAQLLRQRLHFERRLPLLAVIATAAPLMGLLGTVVGMVKTFALITVFGTGNAGKLASGISEVLVATELGLAVAIPTLVVHGFISQRIHRKLAAQERYALEFVTAAKSSSAEISVA